MAHERATRPLNPQQIVPADYSWQQLLDADGTELEVVVHPDPASASRSSPARSARSSGRRRTGSQDPAKLKRLIVDLIDQENWSASGTDLKGDAYEELLAKGASDNGLRRRAVLHPASTDPGDRRRRSSPEPSDTGRRPRLRHRRLPPRRPRARLAATPPASRPPSVSTCATSSSPATSWSTAPPDWLR
ncbi:MAG: hypothetical protein WKF76_09540 [Nocardioidaceae bacterium]